MKSLNIEAVSLFSGAGIGELCINEVGIRTTVACELLEKRAQCYKHFFPDAKVIEGDIRNSKIKSKIVSSLNANVKLLIATPPCQGLSSLGKNKVQHHFKNDERNFLIFDVFDIIDTCDFDYILIENVPRFLEMYFPYKGNLYNIIDIINSKYHNLYKIEAAILDAQFFSVPQTRPRAVIKLYKKNLKWSVPIREKPTALQEAIGHLPSLESGEDSGIPWHYARKHATRQTLALKHTPPGKSALNNTTHYPQKKNGERIKGFHNTYKRMVWDKPAHARTTYCGSLSSHNNVHPGRSLPDGTYSDARVLTILETMIVHSIPLETAFPEWANDSFIRQIIGESIPPLMLLKILSRLGL
jgi:DNA (cytosine-5)-methyltransferase 1